MPIASSWCKATRNLLHLRNKSKLSQTGMERREFWVWLLVDRPTCASGQAGSKLVYHLRPTALCRCTAPFLKSWITTTHYILNRLARAHSKSEALVCEMRCFCGCQILFANHLWPTTQCSTICPTVPNHQRYANGGMGGWHDRAPFRHGKNRE
jgi:hypothetical protein